MQLYCSCVCLYSVCEDGELKCEDYDCPVDCIISTWSDWGSCSVESCGGGYRERTREVTPGTAGGEACPCDVIERDYCNEDPCEGRYMWYCVTIVCDELFSIKRLNLVEYRFFVKLVYTSVFREVYNHDTI